MAMYEFKADDGEIIQVSYPMAQAPELGFVIKKNGKKYVRILSSSASIGVQESIKPYVTVAGPKGIPGCQTDPKTGRSVIENRNQEREHAKRAGMEWL